MKSKKTTWYILIGTAICVLLTGCNNEKKQILLLLQLDKKLN
ncbi:hypothetical protein [Melissococcus plutonius]|nr:hypothetical protein [Melissococcus plutonius]MBB5176814.1 hypothetical protein [Melissococcus plutonius]